MIRRSGFKVPFHAFPVQFEINEMIVQMFSIEYFIIGSFDAQCTIYLFCNWIPSFRFKGSISCFLSTV